MSETTDAAVTDSGDTIVVADLPDPTAGQKPVEQQAEADPPDPETEAKPHQDDAPKRKPWWETRIAEAAFAEREARRQAQALEAELAAYRRVQQPAPGTPDAVEQRAQEIVSEIMFVNECNAISDAGEAKFPDFTVAARTYAMLGEVPRPFLEGIASLGRDEGARVYYELAKDPDEASRIMRLPPVRMAIELTRRASAAPKAPPPISKAPPPIVPLDATNARNGGMPPPDNDEAYREWFRKEYQKRR